MSTGSILVVGGAGYVGAHTCKALRRSGYTPVVFGHGYSVKEVLDTIAAETGVRLKAVTASRRQGDPPVLVADATLAKTELGFTPSLSDLKSIVKTAWGWHSRAHPKRPPHSSTQDAARIRT